MSWLWNKKIQTDDIVVKFNEELTQNTNILETVTGDNDSTEKQQCTLQ